ncbi:MAG: serine--tRNA ligase [Candidatus Ancillula sp.]|jgi:seryl-tRNA synthetase|nr:serine--tRNA ligase [Candidatus Ancillula sp.]
MIDIKFVRTNPEVVKASQVARQEDPNIVDELLRLDDKKRAVRQEFDELRRQQGEIGKKIAALSGDEKVKLLESVAELAKQVSDAKDAVAKSEEEFDDTMLRIQNVIEGAPSGGEEDFVVLKEVGERNTEKSMGFKPKAHWELGEALDIIDTKRGSKVGGSRFYFLKGLGARLDLGLANMALELAVENGFTPMITPTLVRPEIMRGTGFIGRHDSEVYRLGGEDDSYLVGTSEVALAGYHQDEFIEFPEANGGLEALRYAGFSACYRREAGAAGKDTRGIIRVHQFHKLEMFVYCPEERADEEHQRLLKMEEQMIRDLELPYRVIDTAAGDLGSSAARKFDCEAWLPSENRFLELTSTSNCTTFQARRLNIRTKSADGNKTVATLNGTLATTRWIVAILENHQQPDGTVIIPEKLRPFVGGVSLIEPPTTKGVNGK